MLYELAAPSTSEEILAQVQEGSLPPTLEAVKEAKEAERIAREAERQARIEAERIQQQFSAIHEEILEKQTRDRASLSSDHTASRAYC